MPIGKLLCTAHLCPSTLLDNERVHRMVIFRSTAGGSTRSSRLRNGHSSHHSHARFRQMSQAKKIFTHMYTIKFYGPSQRFWELISPPWSWPPKTLLTDWKPSVAHLILIDGTKNLIYPFRRVCQLSYWSLLQTIYLSAPLHPLLSVISIFAMLWDANTGIILVRDVENWLQLTSAAL